jgi:hypothetical protein
LSTQLPLSGCRIPQDGSQTRITDCDKPKRANGVIHDELARAQQTAEAETSRKRVADSGLTMRLSGNCLQALRDRILSAEAYPERTDSDELLSELFASATVQPVTSDRLDPAQLQQLQQLVHAYHDQISWSSDDIGCLHAKYKHFYMRIPTEPGARCKQKPYWLSLKKRSSASLQFFWNKALSEGLPVPLTSSLQYCSS